MADDKGKSKSGGGGNDSSWAYILGALFFLILIGQLFSIILNLLGLKNPDTGEIDPHAVTSFKIVFTSILSTFQAISLFVCVLFLIAILFLKFRMYEIKKFAEVKEKAAKISEKRSSEKPEPNKKWLKVLEHVNSYNPGDWRLAILEADILLNEILEKMGYKGMTIGDKLKTIERSDFSNLDAAWEAHKIRNSIAHEGSEYSINQNEAKRVISLYEKVFKEFYFI